MNENFIPWPDYAICPNCKKKVNTPKIKEFLMNSNKIGSMTCPFCKATIKYIKPQTVPEPITPIK